MRKQVDVRYLAKPTIVQFMQRCRVALTDGFELIGPVSVARFGWFNKKYIYHATFVKYAPEETTT